MFNIDESLPFTISEAIIVASYDIGKKIRNDETISDDFHLIIYEQKLDDFLISGGTKEILSNNRWYCSLERVVEYIEDGVLQFLELPNLSAEFYLPQFYDVLQAINKIDLKDLIPCCSIVNKFYLHQLAVFQKTGKIISSIEGTEDEPLIIPSMSNFNLPIRKEIMKLRKSLWHIN